LHGSHRKDTRKKTRKGFGRENSVGSLQLTLLSFPKRKPIKNWTFTQRSRANSTAMGEKKIIKKQRRAPFDRVT